jgi:hypothetical protein
MIVKRDGMGLAAPDPKILGSDRGKLPTAGYLTNPLTKTPIPTLSASAANPKSSLFYSPVTMNPTFKNTSTPVQCMTSMNSSFSNNNNMAPVQSFRTINLAISNNDIGTVTPIGTMNPSFTNSNIGPVTPLGTMNQTFDNNNMASVTHIGSMNTFISSNNIGTVTPIGTLNRSFNTNSVAPEQASASSDNPSSDNEDEVQRAGAAELRAKRRAERIAFARTFGDAIRSTTGEEVELQFDDTLSLDTEPSVTAMQFQGIQAINTSWP